MEAWQYTGAIVIGYALLILVLGMGRWSRLSRVAIDDYFKVAPGFGFVVLYLGIAGIGLRRAGRRLLVGRSA